MKRYNILIIVCLFPAVVYCQNIPNEIISAFETGNAVKLSTYFHKSIEMNINDDVYKTSSIQAARIIEKFFKEYPPESFELNMNHSVNDSKYAIGLLKTQRSSFRVNLYFMEEKASKTIYFLSIEKE